MGWTVANDHREPIEKVDVSPGSLFILPREHVPFQVSTIKMSSRPYFQRNFSSGDASWYRERKEEDWSPRSQDSDHEPSFDSDEENQNHESNVINLTDSSSSSLDSPLPWMKNSSFSLSSPSTSLALPSQGNKVNQEGGILTESSKEFIPKSSSLVIGKRSRAIGLKDIDLTRNLAARHIREAKEANKSPKKSHLFSPLSRHMSCPAFSSPSEIFPMGPSDRHGRTGQTGPTGLSRGLNFEGDSQFKSPIVSGTSLKVAAKTTANALKLFSCPEDHANAMQHLPLDKSDCDWCERRNIATTGGAVQKRDNLFLTPKLKAVEVIDLTVGDQPSGSKTSCHSNQSECQKNSEKNGNISTQNTAVRNRVPLKKKASTFSFSDDEDSDSTEHPAKRDKETSQQHAANKEAPNKPHSKKGFMKMCIFFATCALSVLLLSVYFHVNPHGFCLDSEFSRNISGIGAALKAELYGQHIAQKIISSALKNHFNKKDVRKPLVMSFHGWTGIGKNFVSNIITEHLFKRKTHSPFVHKFIIPLNFPHKSEVEIYNKQLQSWILGNISHCRKGGLFIFDEMDKIHIDMLDTINAAILEYRGKKAETGYGNMVFLFLSNSGGEAINKHVLKHVLEGKMRESLTLSEMEIIFHNIVKSTPDVWFADLLKSEVIDHLVPFLPLERTHVKQCIRTDLVKKGFPVKEALVTEIADQMEYFPEQYGFFSVSGCKKVSSRVDVVMG